MTIGAIWESLRVVGVQCAVCARASKEYIPRVCICIAAQMNRQTAFASEFGLAEVLTEPHEESSQLVPPCTAGTC